MKPEPNPQRVLDYADPALPSAEELRQAEQQAAAGQSTSYSWSDLPIGDCVELAGHAICAILESIDA